MKKLHLLVLILAACASTPRSEFVDHAVFEGSTVGQVRDAVLDVLQEVAPSQSAVRATGDLVLTEGRFGVCGRDVACGSGTHYIGHDTGTPWTTIEVRLLDLGEDAGVNVEVEYETSRHCGNGYVPVTCLPEELGSTGYLERRIVEGIRARLEAKGGVADIVPE